MNNQHPVAPIPSTINQPTTNNQQPALNQPINKPLQSSTALKKCEYAYFFHIQPAFLHSFPTFKQGQPKMIGKLAADEFLFGKRPHLQGRVISRQGCQVRGVLVCSCHRVGSINQPINFHVRERIDSHLSNPPQPSTTLNPQQPSTLQVRKASATRINHHQPLAASAINHQPPTTFLSLSTCFGTFCSLHGRYCLFRRLFSTASGEPLWPYPALAALLTLPE